MAFLGGYITLNPKYFKLVAGLFLVLAATLLVIREYSKSKDSEIMNMPLPYSL